MVALAQQNKQQMAVLLLDFEKAYDKVDWDFLEAVLSSLGFPNAWINGVSALYRQASNSVLFTRGYGPIFPGRLGKDVLLPLLFLSCMGKL